MGEAAVVGLVEPVRSPLSGDEVGDLVNGKDDDGDCCNGVCGCDVGSCIGGNEEGEGGWPLPGGHGYGGPPPAEGSPSGGGNGSNGGFPPDEGEGGWPSAGRDDGDTGPPPADDCPSGEGNGGNGTFPPDERKGGKGGKGIWLSAVRDEGPPPASGCPSGEGNGGNG